MRELNLQIMRWSLSAANAVPRDQTMTGCERALDALMEVDSSEPDDTKGVCDECGRTSWISLAPICCPYCGSAETEEDAAKALRLAQEHAAGSKDESNNSEDDDMTADMAAVEKERARAAKARATAEKDKEKAAKEREKEKAKEAKAKAKEKAAKEKAKEKEKAAKEKAAAKVLIEKGKAKEKEKVAKEKARAATQLQVVAVVQLTSEPLQREVDKAKAFQAQAMGGYWDLANTIREINENKTYLLEVNSKGYPVYSWGEFCTAVFGFSRRHADNLIQLTKTYTRAQIETIGVSKLSLIAGAATEDQQKLTEMAAKGATRAEMREAKATTPQVTPKESKLMVVMLEQRRWEVPLFARQRADTVKTRAAALAEHPHGETITANGMRLLYWVKRDETQFLTIEIEVQRQDKIDD